MASASAKRASARASTETRKLWHSRAAREARTSDGSSGTRALPERLVLPTVGWTNSYFQL
eukprot:6115069-Prymnesium_polylepis.1